MPEQSDPSGPAAGAGTPPETSEGRTDAAEAPKQPPTVASSILGQHAPNSFLAQVARQQSVITPLVALVLAFAIGGILIRAQGVDPMWAYKYLFTDALGTSSGIERTLEKSTPLVLAGLAVLIPMRAGMFNIGGQGQLMVGAIVAAWLGTSVGGGVAAIVLAIIGAMLAGVAWASIAATLKATRGVHEVISTIMLNSIATAVVAWLLTGPLQDRGASYARTAAIPDSAWMPLLGGVVPLGFVIALIAAVGVGLVFRFTTAGFRFDTAGKNPHAARYAGISIRGVIWTTMGIAGAFAGLAGAIEVLGVVHRYETGVGGTIGFDGITIALLARTNPYATVPAAVLVGALRAGAPALQFNTGIQPEIVDLLLAITLLLVSLPILGKLLFRQFAGKTTSLASSWGGS